MTTTPGSPPRTAMITLGTHTAAPSSNPERRMTESSDARQLAGSVTKIVVNTFLNVT